MKKNKNIDENIFLSLIQTIFTNVFKFTNLPDNVNNYMINLALASGQCAIYDIDNFSTASVNKGYQCTPAFFADVVKNDFTCDAYTTSGTDYAITLYTKDKNFGIIRNGYNIFPTIKNWLRYAEKFAIIDTSENSLMKWARTAPIIRTSGINLTKYEELAKNIIEKYDVLNVISDDTYILNENASKENPVINITDTNLVEKMHFISEYNEELWRQLCTLHGIPFSTTAKSSQNLQDELHDMDFFSKMFNESLLNCIKEDVKKTNDMLNLSIKVDYSDVLKQQIEVIDKTKDLIQNESEVKNENNQ